MSESEHEVRVYHDPRKERSLSDAVLEAISKATGEELTREECALFDDIDPESLETLFRSDGSGNTSVLFNTPNAGIRIEPGSDIVIRVASLTDSEE